MATFDIKLYGYGAEMVFGQISKDVYEFWSDQSVEAVTAHLFVDHPDSNSEVNPVTDPQTKVWLGEMSENGDYAHVVGAFADDCTVEVVDEDNNEIYSETDLDLITRIFVDPKEQLPGYYIKAWQTEKGDFLSASFDADEFEPHKLVFHATSIDGHTVIDNVLYDNVQIENEVDDRIVKDNGFELYDDV